MTDEPEQLSTEDKLARLRDARQQLADLEKYAKDLRNELVAEMRGQGSRYFIGSDGAKHFGYYSASETTVVDLGRLRELDPEAAELVSVVEVDYEVFKRLVQINRIPASTLAQVTRIVPRSETIRFDNA